MWNVITETLPANGQTVWLRIYTNYATPFQAVYDTALQQFTTVTTSLIIPAYVVTKWKAV